jgi:hypothetical protein
VRAACVRLIATAQDFSIDARPEVSSGDLILRPMVSGDFPVLSADEIEQRIGQLAGETPRAVLRVGQTIVLLDPTQTQQARALVARGRVPKAEVPAFKKDPASWMAEHIFPDIETEFSPRVTGIGFWKAAYAGSMWEEGEDWFGKKPQPDKKPPDENQGNGGTCNSFSTVRVSYKGYLTDGSVFDESAVEGVSFGLQQVIKGWTEGIPYFKEGGNGKLLIPSALGYGKQGTSGIPANSVLIFDVKLLEIH